MVKKDGQVSNVKSLCDIGGTCCKEAVRELKAMPKWKACACAVQSADKF